jgi:hypothetical protein
MTLLLPFLSVLPAFRFGPPSPADPGASSLVFDPRSQARVSSVGNHGPTRSVSGSPQPGPLGAPFREPQANPLLDNYEGMAITAGGPGLAGVTLMSDDNFSATPFTRVLNLAVRLP